MVVFSCSITNVTILTPHSEIMEKYRIFIVKDRFVEQAVYDGDLDTFREIIEDGAEYLEEEFETEEEATAYISGLYAGMDERSPAGFVVLHEDIEADLIFIEILKEQ